MSKKKKNIFKLLYSEYKNKNYSGLFNYGMRVFDVIFPCFLIYLVTSSINHASTLSTVALVAISLSFVLNLFLLMKESKKITRVSTEEIKEYLLTIEDKEQRENKVKMLASCMLSNKDAALFLDDFIRVKIKDIEIGKIDNVHDYEHIIQSLSSVDVKQKIKEPHLA